ncbi:histidine phosphatase family protein [Novosphingobium sp. BL-8A]|uniref:histidine phosphatase family protein n=1 Tax=Novosphingobium sp. BL-8A TaxID=3127639 RepID=UPI00375661CC
MATALLLLCIAPTASSREGRFPDSSEPLDEAGRRSAGHERIEERFRARMFRSPARAAEETAGALGLDAAIAEELADIDHGSWSGRSFAEIGARPFTDWLAHPDRGTPDGESMEQVRARVGRWLDHVAGLDSAICAITHPMTVRAALAHAIGIPLQATLAIDIAPLSRTILSFNRSWRLQSLGLAEMAPRG